MTSLSIDNFETVKENVGANLEFAIALIKAVLEDPKKQIADWVLDLWKLALIKDKKPMRGAYKTIYFFEQNVAIALEHIGYTNRRTKQTYKDYKGNVVTIDDEIKRRTTLYKLLDAVTNNNTKCLVNYPEKYIFIKDEKTKSVLCISKLNYCPRGDALDSLGQITSEQLQNIMVTYEILHQNNIFHVDVKPENMLLCKCSGRQEDALFVSDIDDAVIFQDSKGDYLGKVIGTTPYIPFYGPYRTIKHSNNRFYMPVSKNELKFFDYYALAYIYVLNHWAKLEYNFEKEPYLNARKVPKKRSDIQQKLNDNFAFSNLNKYGYNSYYRAFKDTEIAQFQDFAGTNKYNSLLRLCIQLLNYTDTPQFTDKGIQMNSGVLEAVELIKKKVNEIRLDEDMEDITNRLRTTSLEMQKNKDKKIKF